MQGRTVVPCGLEIHLYPRAVLFKRRPHPYWHGPLATGSGEGQNILVAESMVLERKRVSNQAPRFRASLSPTCWASWSVPHAVDGAHHLGLDPCGPVRRRAHPLPSVAMRPRTSLGRTPGPSSRCSRPPARVCAPAPSALYPCHASARALHNTACPRGSFSRILRLPH